MLYLIQYAFQFVTQKTTKAKRCWNGNISYYKRPFDDLVFFKEGKNYFFEFPFYDNVGYDWVIWSRTYARIGYFNVNELTKYPQTETHICIAQKIISHCSYVLQERILLAFVI